MGGPFFIIGYRDSVLISWGPRGISSRMVSPYNESKAGSCERSVPHIRNQRRSGFYRCQHLAGGDLVADCDTDFFDRSIDR